MDVGAAFAANSKSAILVEPRQGALNDPSGLPESASVGTTTFANDRFYRPGSQLPTILLGFVSAVTLKLLWFGQGPTRLALHRRYRIDKVHQLSHIVTIGAGEHRRKRNTSRVGYEVVLTPCFAAICRVRPRRLPAETALTEALSTTAREKSSLSASRKRASSTSWIRAHAPCSCQYRK